MLTLETPTMDDLAGDRKRKGKKLSSKLDEQTRCGCEDRQNEGRLDTFGLQAEHYD
jgi:hypothetical protein